MEEVLRVCILLDKFAETFYYYSANGASLSLKSNGVNSADSFDTRREHVPF